MLREPGAERIVCSIPFCGRTAARAKFPQCEEIICGKHYRMASRTWRARRSRLVRFMRRSLDLDKTQHAWRLEDELWRRIKKQIIERVVGL